MLSKGGMTVPLRRPGVTGNPSSLMEDLHGVCGYTNIDLLFYQLIGDGVIITLDLDMIIDMNPGLLPLGVDIGLSRKGFKGGLIQGFKEGFTGPGQFFEGPFIEFCDQFTDGTIEFIEAKKGDMAESGQDPPFHHLHSDFHFCLVSRFSYPGRDDGTAVMGSHFLITGVEVGFIVAGLFDPRFKVVRNHDLGDPTEKDKCPAVGADPIGQGLSP
jgi:hypothetical protein